MSTNHWLRLWHDMPNDPKFRTIARISNQPISLVLSIYMHMLVDASRNVTRGHVCVTTEDLASALDVTEEQIDSVLNAMEGRLKDGDYLSGWDKRQPKKEDVGNDETGAKSAAERKAAQRAREKEEREMAEKSTNVTECHGASRNVTTEKRREEERREEISKEDTHTLSTPQVCVSDFEKQNPTAPALAAMAMKKGGIGAVSPQHPELLAMVKAGVAPEQFEQAAQAATAKSKGFAYALGILKGQLREANEIASDGLAMPTKPWDESRTTIESEGERLGLGRWDEAKWSVGQGKSFAEYTKSVAQARETMEVA